MKVELTAKYQKQNILDSYWVWSLLAVMGWFQLGLISTYTYLANYVYVVVDCMTKLDLS